ncbi:hypothetical protein LSM04_004878 [Trypanosoma melophagium]|uniref:uncharacterized protein n=1 Tax=Trypanosoma melophagium TaxID=715481 RepID=UPI00351AA85C|nr:hypothetical protein LSM04_004878 [Trypanosoma melophagium]
MIVIGEAALEFALETLESYNINSKGASGVDNKSTESENDLAEAVLSLLPIGIAAPVKKMNTFTVSSVVAVFALPSELTKLSLDALSNTAWQLENEWGVLSASVAVSHHIVRSAKFVHKMGKVAETNCLVSQDE